MSITSVSKKLDHAKTLDIIQASTFLGAHKETVRRMVASGEIPGVKIGRSWRFIEQDLMDHMRSHYNTIVKLTVNTSNRSTQLCPLQKETTSGGLTFHTKEKDYAKALGLV